MVDKETLQKHAVASTAIVSLANPVYAWIETHNPHLSTLDSIVARVLGTALTFGAGAGYCYQKGRECWHKMFNLEHASAYYKTLHEGIYSAVFAVPFSPAFYAAASLVHGKIPSLESLTSATKDSIIPSFFLGMAMGPAIDVYLDLTMDGENVLPQAIRSQSRRRKRILAGALTTAALGAAVAMYVAKESR